MQKILFIDESGDHSLNKIDLQYPIFVLGGAIFEESYAKNTLPQKVNLLKNKLFGTENIILRTTDISRNQKGFELLKDKHKREIFYQDINSLMRELEYKALACVIDKREHVKLYGQFAFDPYNFSLQILVERFCYELRKSDQGIIIAESRDLFLNKILLNEWERIKLEGTKHVKPSEIRIKIRDFKLMKKSSNLAGLQIADLIVSPIGRDYLKKKPKEDIEIIKEKLRRNSKGSFLGHGLVTLPKK